jgi:hypothetical protein
MPGRRRLAAEDVGVLMCMRVEVYLGRGGGDFLGVLALFVGAAGAAVRAVLLLFRHS